MTDENIESDEMELELKPDTFTLNISEKSNFVQRYELDNETLSKLSRSDIEEMENRLREYVNSLIEKKFSTLHTDDVNVEITISEGRLSYLCSTFSSKDEAKQLIAVLAHSELSKFIVIDNPSNALFIVDSVQDLVSSDGTDKGAELVEKI